MKHNMECVMKCLMTFVLSAAMGLPAHAADLRKDNTLWYDRPAEYWVEALPLGNGRLGAMVYGGTQSDTIQINEDTFWSGSPYNNINPKALFRLGEIRDALNRRDYKTAQDLSLHNITADRNITGHGMAYESVGNMVLTFPSSHAFAKDYRRELSLDRALARTEYTVDGVVYEREAFTSFADDVIVIRLKASRKGALQFKTSFCQPLKDRVSCTVTRSGTENGELRVYSVPSAPNMENVANGLHCITYIRVIAPEAKTVFSGNTVSVSEATDAYIIISSATNFVSYKDITADAETKAKAGLTKFLAKGNIQKEYQASLARHEDIYQKQFNRVTLDLGSNATQETKPTNRRIAEFRDTTDPHLAAMYFQYGRYLMISSSQRGTQPANLQGIWNPDAGQYPAWDSKYTTNINVEMNYWPAEVTNLSECHWPFLDMVRDVSQTGRATAREMYGARGWALHHNTDIWRSTGAVDYHPCSIWPTCNAWFCSHLWEHFLFTGDRKYLSDVAFPIMADACRFYMDFLTTDAATGYLVASPSNSPENNPGMESYHDSVFNKDYRPAVFQGVAMDNQMIYDLLYTTRQAAEMMASTMWGDAAARLMAFADSLDDMRLKLPPMMVGQYGQMQEWLDDWDREETGHRHVSHLWCAYPGRQISPYRTPELTAAVRKSLIGRGDASRGWSMGWKVCLWARLLDGNHAYKLIENQLNLKEPTATIRDADGGTYANMFDAHPPFQIDGNFGCCAGIAEMIVQSHDEAVHLLPAIPDVWPYGEVTGLKARGGFEIVRMRWENGRVRNITIRSTVGGNLRLRSRTALQMANGKQLTRVQEDSPNMNPLMRRYDVLTPIVKDMSKIVYAPLDPTYLYDVMTTPGTEYTFVAAE